MRSFKLERAIEARLRFKLQREPTMQEINAAYVAVLRAKEKR